MDFDLSNISNTNLISYLTIIIIICFILSKFDIKLNIVFGTVLGAFIVNYMYTQKKKESDEFDQTIKNQFDSIKPKPQLATKYVDIIQFLFSIQDLYIYNPQAYEN